MGMGLALVMALWITMVFDPHWLVMARTGAGIVLKLPVLLNAALLLFLLFGLIENVKVRERWQWNLPFLAYVFAGAMTLPTTINAGRVRDVLIGLLTWWVLMVGTIAFMRTVKRAETLLLIYAFQFLWWGVWGATRGNVGWHTTLANFDDFGAVNVCGVALCYFLAVASPNRKLRWLLYAAMGLSAIGVIASFARGAFLAMCFVFLVIWIRSPNKLRTFGAGVGAAVVMVIAILVLFDEGFFMAEIMSTFEEGVQEGTGAERWLLWGAAWRIFLENPLFGAGPSNWGAFGASFFQYGDLGGRFVNPGAMYNMSLHNLYLTTLAELGVVGALALIWILVDYFRRNAALRSEAAQRRWRAFGGRLSLKHISLGLESAMVAFLVNAVFYPMTGNHAFYTLIGLNLLLHGLAVRGAPAEPRGPSFHSRRRHPTIVSRAVPIASQRFDGMV
jgi:O-antigen ligase